MTRQRGLTLVELLVALGVFSLLGLASVSVLSTALSGQAQLAASTDEITRLERARALLRADLLQAVPRAVREEDGRTAPAFAGGTSLVENGPLAAGRGEAAEEIILLTLTRAGWDNPGAARPRSELQRVTYLAIDGQLVRRTRPYLDAAPETPSTDQVLLTGLEDIDAAFAGPRGWETGFAGTDAAPFPLAARVSFTHPGLGPLDNDFLVAGP